MNTLAVIVVGWFAASVPVGLVMGRLLSRASRPLDEQAEPAMHAARPAVALHKAAKLARPAVSRVLPFPQQTQPIRVRNQD